jgi:D-alanine-D-alanine ligase
MPGAPPMRIGIAFDLKTDFEAPPEGAPDDLLEEYDSEATIDAIAAALRENGHEPVRVGGGRGFLERVLRDPPDLVFNIAEGRGTRSREAHVPAACEMLGIPVTHSDPLTCALTLDKGLAKRVVASAGLRTPDFRVVESAGEARGLGLRFPLIVKPACEGSSVGVRLSSRVTDEAGLEREIERCASGYREPVLVEEFCPGMEMTVGILGTGTGARAIGALAILPRAARADEFVYSLEVKRDWESQVDYAHPPPIDPSLVAEAEELALAAHRVLGCRDVSRVDVRLDASGEPSFIEVNPLPGLNPRTGDLCILCSRAGLTYAELIGSIVENAWKRR